MPVIKVDRGNDRETRTIALAWMTESGQDKSYTKDRAERLVADILSYFSQENARALVKSASAGEDSLTVKQNFSWKDDWEVQWSRKIGHSWLQRDMSAHMDSKNLHSYGHLVSLKQDKSGLALFVFAPNGLQDPTDGPDPRWSVLVSLMQQSPDSGLSYASVGPVVVLSFRDTEEGLHTRGIMSAIADTMDSDLVLALMNFDDGTEGNLGKAFEAVLNDSLPSRLMSS